MIGAMLHLFGWEDPRVSIIAEGLRSATADERFQIRHQMIWNSWEWIREFAPEHYRFWSRTLLLFNRGDFTRVARRLRPLMADGTFAGICLAPAR